MIKGSETRITNHPTVDPIFIDRWSPRAMSGECIEEPALKVLFEAARWAPSSYNNQPWRFLYARNQTEHWPLFLDLLADANKAWAEKAAVLVVILSKTTFDYNGKPSITHTFDAGAAWENLALQGFSHNYVVHGMQGFDYDRAQAALNVPEDFKVEAMIAIGKPGKNELLPDQLREKETPSDRKPLEEIICEGPFNF
ncbi:MAG: nitroreductase family protein [Pseudomonadota bacterium]